MVMSAKDNVGIQQGPLHLYPIIDRLSRGSRPVKATTNVPTADEIRAAGPAYQKLIESRANQSGQSVEDFLNSTIRKEEFKIGAGEKEVLKKIVITGTPNEEAGQEGEFQYLIDMLNDDGYDIHLWFLSDFARGWMTKYLKYIRLNKPKLRQRPTPKHMVEITRRLNYCVMTRDVMGEFDWIT